jgi:hypothetical protein
MTTIITITNEPTTVLGGLEYDYSGQDRILKNLNKNEYEIFYCGQNQGGLDHQLISSIANGDTFRIYYRSKTNIPYTFLGETDISSVIQYRTVPLLENSVPTSRLQIHLVIRNEHVVNQIVPNTLYDGVGKYKKTVLNHSNFPINKNTNLGFYKL